VSLTAAVDRLWRAVHQLRDDEQALRLHAIEDRPVGEPNKLVDDVGTASLTLAGWVEEVVDGAAQAVAANRYPTDLPRLHQALGASTEAAERAAGQLTDELTGSRRLDQLDGLRRAGREQLAWVAAIKQGLDRANESAWEVAFALTDCWRELAERAPGGERPGARPGGAVPAAAHRTPPPANKRRP
jgi:hypothetical protein